jgi:hypothetical protein
VDSLYFSNDHHQSFPVQGHILRVGGDALSFQLCNSKGGGGAGGGAGGATAAGGEKWVVVAEVMGFPIQFH